MLLTITEQSPLSCIYKVGDCVSLDSIITKIMSFHKKNVDDTPAQLDCFLDTMLKMNTDEISKTIVEMCTPRKTRKRTYDEAFGS